MAEINLLKTPSAGQSLMEKLPGIVIKLLAVLALAVLGYYGYLFVKVKSVNKQAGETQTAIAQSKNEALAMPGREEFLVRQAQLKEYGGLVASHDYISKLFPSLAKVTLKSAYYTSMNMTSDGKLTLTAMVPDLQSLDKFLQVFNQPEVSKNFNNVRTSGFSKQQTADGTAYTFQLLMDFNPALISAAANN